VDPAHVWPPVPPQLPSLDTFELPEDEPPVEVPPLAVVVAVLEEQVPYPS
jgi:hypothetical protein